MKKHTIALVPGDQVGEELIRQARKVLHYLLAHHALNVQMIEVNAFGPAIRQTGSPLPSHESKKLQGCQAVLIGNIGHHDFNLLPPDQKPEAALLQMRKLFKVSINLRHMFIQQGLASLSPLKEAIVDKGFDICVVRDILGGMLSGKGETVIQAEGVSALDREYYHEEMVRNCAHFAFQTALSRRGKVTSLDKANVLASSVLWRKTMTDCHAQYPQCTLEHAYIDSAAMEVITDPFKFDTIATANVFGDILSDEIAQLTGTPGFFASAELASDGRGIYTPNQLHHPKGEEYAGLGIVSPLGILRATQSLLKYSLLRPELALLIEEAIQSLLRKNLYTKETHLPESLIVHTDHWTDELIQVMDQMTTKRQTS